jgi:hypothetical protein
MKVGDAVRRPDDESQVWIITNIRSDARAFWIQLDGYHGKSQKDVWHDARYFEVDNETR